MKLKTTPDKQKRGPRTGWGYWRDAETKKIAKPKRNMGAVMMRALAKKDAERKP